MASFKTPFFQTPAGKVIAAVGATLSILLLAYMSYKFFFTDSVGDQSRRKGFVDSTNGKGFYLDVDVGTEVPMMSPYSHEKTAYPAEKCFWNADGTTRTDPTLVLINEWVNKPGPTFCPDCGRLVVGRNPAPAPGKAPPPTKQQYMARNGGR